MIKVKGELPEQVIMGALDAALTATQVSSDVCVVHPDMVKRFVEAGLMVITKDIPFAPENEDPLGDVVLSGEDVPESVYTSLINQMESRYRWIPGEDLIVVAEDPGTEKT